MPTPHLSIVASAISNDPRHAPKRSRELGFNGVLFDAYGSSLNIPELSVSGRREFRHVLSAQDQQLVALRSDTGPKGLGPGADVDQALSRLDRVMEAAAGLVAPLVTVDLGPLPEPPPIAKPKPKITPEQAGLILLPTSADIAAARQPEAPSPPPPDPSFLSQVDGALAELGRRADRYGVTVALRSELASFSAVERALRAARCPWFGVDLDPVAVLRDEWDLDEVFSRLGSFFRHVRARDAVRGADRRTRPAVVGQGSVNWGDFLSNLEASGYAGWITVDPTELPDRTAAAVAARRHISTQDL